MGRETLTSNSSSPNDPENSRIPVITPQISGARASQKPAASSLVSQEAKSPAVPFTDPFVGLAGHAFLHLCQAVEVATGWMKLRSPHADAVAETLLTSSSHGSLRSWGSCSLGMVSCTVVAAGLIPLFSSSSIKAALPLLFLLIIGFAAFRFGRLAGVLGTGAAAFLFAKYLFDPPGIGVSDPIERSRLIWMIVLGVVVSDLLDRFRQHRMARHKA